MRLSSLLSRFSVKSLLPVIALAACLGGVTVHAAPVWQETDVLAGELLGAATPTVNSNVVTVAMAGQTVTNTGATAQHLGMYFGWVWTRGAAAPTYTSMPWDNGTGLFSGAGVTASIAHQGAVAQTLRIGDVVGDTWIGTPWAAESVLDGIATDADWVVPFFDFGMMAAGAVVDYAIELVFTFDTAAQAEAFAGFGAFWAYAQGVQAVAQDVPEPGSMALLGLGLLAVVAVRRRKI